MDIIEHSGPVSLSAWMDGIVDKRIATWGIVRIKKSHIRQMTDEAFLLAVRSALQEAEIAHIFFVDDKRIYIAWNGQKKFVYKQLRALIGTALARPGLNVEPSAMVAYIDPFLKGEVLKTALKATGDNTDYLFDAAENFFMPGDMEEESDFSKTKGAKPVLAATSGQVEHFQQLRSQKPHRKQLQLLVVEDQIFSQKLLCEILRSARTRNNNETPLIDAVQGIQDAWKLYLKKAPDLTFIDLGLIDGSGHTLARAMKELDPNSCVVIVTANNYEEELGVARQNNVDGFIAKPYNKKQILDCIDRYVETLKSHTKGALRGTG